MSQPLPCRPAAVIFDMDGLMLDSERAIIDCLRQAAREQDAVIDDAVWFGMIGHTDVVCRQLLMAHLDAAASDRLLARGHALYIEVATRGVPHRPGIVALLDLLARHAVPRAVATSTRRPLALRKLEAADLLWRFDVVCTSSDVAEPKPAPDVYLLAAAQLGVAPADCLVLEDSPTGVRAALAAGMTPIQVPDLLSPDAAVRALGHRIVDSLADAQALIEPWLLATR